MGFSHQGIIQGYEAIQGPRMPSTVARDLRPHSGRLRAHMRQESSRDGRRHLWRRKAQGGQMGVGQMTCPFCDHQTYIWTPLFHSMPLGPCRHCGKEVASSAKKCPACGGSSPLPWIQTQPLWVRIVLPAVVIIVVFAFLLRP